MRTNPKKKKNELSQKILNKMSSLASIFTITLDMVLTDFNISLSNYDIIKNRSPNFYRQAVKYNRNVLITCW